MSFQASSENHAVIASRSAAVPQDFTTWVSSIKAEKHGCTETELMEGGTPDQWLSPWAIVRERFLNKTVDAARKRECQNPLLRSAYENSRVPSPKTSKSDQRTQQTEQTAIGKDNARHLAAQQADREPRAEQRRRERNLPRGLTREERKRLYVHKALVAKYGAKWDESRVLNFVAAPEALDDGTRRSAKEWQSHLAQDDGAKRRRDRVAAARADCQQRVGLSRRKHAAAQAEVETHEDIIICGY